MITIGLNFNPEGLKKSNFPPKGTTTFKILESETLIIADYKYAKSFKWLFIIEKILHRSYFSWINSHMT